jgi:hypothetical protein
MLELSRWEPEVFHRISDDEQKILLNPENPPIEAIQRFLRSIWRFDQRFFGEGPFPDSSEWAVYSLVYLGKTEELIELMLRAFIPLLRPGLWDSSFRSMIGSTFGDDVGHLIYDVEGMEGAGYHEPFNWRANRNNLHPVKIKALMEYTGYPPLADPDIPPQHVWILHTNLQPFADEEYVERLRALYDCQDGISDDAEVEETDTISEKTGPEQFGFLIEDRGLVIELAKIVRSLLQRPDITSELISHIGKLLFAMERLPLPTPGISIDLTMTYRFNDESSFISLFMDDTEFRLSRGGYVYDPAVGGDSYSENVFEVEVGDFRSSVELSEVSDWLDEFKRRALDKEQEIEVEFSGDDSQIPWDEELEADYWDNLNSEYI